MNPVGKALNTESGPATGMDRDSAIALAGAVGDIALVVDSRGVIQDVSTSDGVDSIGPDSAGWVGQLWVDTVTPESRGKVEAIIRDAAGSGVSRRRQVSHHSTAGPDLPVSYVAARLGGESGGFVAVGRDMRAIASLQHRLVETQQALEHDHWRMRHVETRYRLLFQVSAEAILVVDASSRRIVDANDAAGRLFERTTNKLIGQTFPIGIDPTTEPALEEALATARTAGRSGTAEARLTNGGTTVEVSVSCFRQDAVALFLVRFTATGVLAKPNTELGTEIAALLGNAPDGFDVRDVGLRVAHGPQGARDLTLAVEQLTSLVGRISLLDLVRDTSDLVERHFIEAALALTEDNRTAAAAVLGLSRQSLYVKMRRYQLAAGAEIEAQKAS